MEVTFFRHGIAVDRADPLAPVDFERPLTLDGKNKTEAAARGLRALGLKPGVIASSPYRRCMQTARLVADALGLPKKSVRELEALSPGSDPKVLWAELSLVAPASILCVGHGGTIEPAAGWALGLATTAEEVEHAALEDDPAFRALHLKKAGALQLDVRVEPLSAKLAWLVTPKILRQLGRP